MNKIENRKMKNLDKDYIGYSFWKKYFALIRFGSRSQFEIKITFRKIRNDIKLL